MRGKPNTPELFWGTVDRSSPNGCWPTSLPKDKGGYGRLTIFRRPWLAHRLAYVLAKGPIPDGLCVLHNCPTGDNPACCNPAHLWLGTNAQNIADRDAKGRTATGEGHGSHRHPERVARGERHMSRTHPEALRRGDNHPARINPAIHQGERSGRAKLNDKAVLEMRALHDAGLATDRELAMRYGVCRKVAWAAVSRRSWRHLP